ncbi:MAG: ATP-binding protein [Terracidiphilus sp.]|jgi:hypothetical protein
MENVKIDLGAVLALLTDRLYSTPAVFLRENVQNAIDALRMARIDGPRPDDKGRIEIIANETHVRIEDWGIGMSAADIRDYFWYIGRSSKLSKEAEDCKVIGRFGIGALANFGVCSRVDVETQRKGSPVLRSTVNKTDLESNKTGYLITEGGTLDHYGTIIIGHLISAIDASKFRSYLEAHVRYIPEHIFFNGQIISGCDLPRLPAAGSILDGMKIPLGDVPVEISLHRRGVQGIAIVLSAANDAVSGLLNVGTGETEVLTNRFMVTPSIRRLGLPNMPINGWINTSILRPNVTREGLDRDSTERLFRFLISLCSFIVKVLHSNDLMFTNDEVLSYLARKPFEEIESFLANFSVRLFGRRLPISLGEMTIRSQELHLNVLYSQDDDPPVEIASVATDQNVMVVLAAAIQPSIRPYIIRYIEKHCGAKEIGSFQLGAVPLQEDEETPTMRSVRSAIEETLSRFWAVPRPSVRLCRVPGNSHVAVHESAGEKVFSVNVDSPIFQELERHCGSTVLLPFINCTLLVPFIGPLLVGMIPTDVREAAAAFRPKPYLIRIEKVRTIDLIAGKLGWDGPKDACILIQSDAFKKLEGYYIRLPERVNEYLGQYLTASSPPNYLWYADTLLVLCMVGPEKLIKIELRAQSLIQVDDKIPGSLSGARRFLSYKTGSFLPIPYPAFRDILPIDGPKELNCGFRLFGFKEQDQEIEID